jgi:molybdopterin adenylyltransferase
MTKIRAIAVTVSDSRKPANDISGEILVACLKEINAEIVDNFIVSDDLQNLIETLKTQSTRANLIITTGGTGFSPRDNTPEATRQIIEREAQGIAEAIRFETSKTTPTAMLSRGVCGIRGTCLIINFPGSPKAVRECFKVIKSVLPHAINLLTGNSAH